MSRLLAVVLFTTLSASLALAQPDATPFLQSAATAPPSPVEIPSRPQILRRIALAEAALRTSVSGHIASANIAQQYLSLGNLCKDAALYRKSEDAIGRAITLLQSGPQIERAQAITQLAMLHVVMGKLGRAEKDQLHALSIYQMADDPITLALAWNDLAGVYLKQQHFKKALDYAERAFAVLGNRADVPVASRIAVRQTLGFTLCGIHNCSQGIPLLREALDLSRNTFGESSLIAGVSEYVLGYAIWQSGERSNAAYWMEHGTEVMGLRLGPVHPIYVGAMRQYALFLHQTGRTELAASADSIVRLADDTVDARSFAGLLPQP